MNEEIQLEERFNRMETFLIGASKDLIEATLNEEYEQASLIKTAIQLVLQAEAEDLSIITGHSSTRIFNDLNNEIEALFTMMLECELED